MRQCQDPKEGSARLAVLPACYFFTGRKGFSGSQPIGVWKKKMCVSVLHLSQLFPKGQKTFLPQAFNQNVTSVFFFKKKFISGSGECGQERQRTSTVRWCMRMENPAGKEAHAAPQ